LLFSGNEAVPDFWDGLFVDEIISMQMKRNSRLHEKDNQLDEEFKKKISEMIIDKQKKTR
jgi:hypothetical protein